MQIKFCLVNKAREIRKEHTNYITPNWPLIDTGLCWKTNKDKKIGIFDKSKVSKLFVWKQTILSRLKALTARRGADRPNFL